MKPCYSLPCALLIAAPAVRRCLRHLTLWLFVVLAAGASLLGLSASFALVSRLEALERAWEGTAIIQVPTFPAGPESMPMVPLRDRGPDPTLSPERQLDWWLRSGKLKRA